MAFRTAEAQWQGTVNEGQGSIALGSGVFSGPYSFRSRTEETKDTNPEELLAAAHAGCFTMSLSAHLTTAHYTVTRLHTTAQVHLRASREGFSIPAIDLETEAIVPGIDDATFQEIAKNAERNCPVSKALTGTEIHLKARLVSA